MGFVDHATVVSTLKFSMTLVLKSPTGSPSATTLHFGEAMNRPDDVSHTPVEAPDTQPTTQDLEVLQGQSETAEAISR